eukprot:scaffold28898_cov37-Prasinocladus_malaysianus.AAC.2
MRPVSVRDGRLQRLTTRTYGYGKRGKLACDGWPCSLVIASAYYAAYTIASSAVMVEQTDLRLQLPMHIICIADRIAICLNMIHNFKHIQSEETNQHS